jgi:hypothetical protein
LDLHDKNFNKKGIKALQKLRQLELFHFAVLGEKVNSLELKHVSLCLKLLPLLKSVGRYFQSLFLSNYRDLSEVYNFYHDIWGFECPTSESSSSTNQLALMEMFINCDWDMTAVKILPKLRYLHIRNGVRSTYLHIPDTVTELGLYKNVRYDGQLMSFPPQLTSLTLQDCNLLEVTSGGILKQCPNLEVLRLRHCNFRLSDMVLDHASVDMSRSRLQKLVLQLPRHSIPDGLLSLLLQAPLLSRVEVCVREFHVQTEETMRLVEQIRNARILQNITIGRFFGQSLLEIMLAVRAFCPKAVDVNKEKVQNVLE